MNSQPSQKQSRSGNILLMTLVLGGVTAVALCAYLNVISSQNNFAVRSQVWNLCMPLVEAGLEEGLAQINNPGTTNLATQGWTWDSTAKVFTRQRAINDSYYVVTVQTNLNTAPIITSTGYVPSPVTVGTGKNSFLASAVPAPGVAYISRKVQVKTVKDVMFSKALVTKNGIDFNGNNVRVDSYDSSIGAYGGSNIGDKGDVTCNADVTGNSVATGNGDIWGHLSVGPKANLSMGPNSVVGSVAWHAGGNKNAQVGWLRKDANVLMPDVQAPWTANTYSAPGPGSGADYLLVDGNYETAGNFTVSSGQELRIKGDATLWVHGKFTMAGTLKMTSGNYALKVYVSGSSIDLSGDTKKSHVPSDLLIYGLPSCTSISVATGSEFAAAIYAPQADMSLTGNANFYGSSVTKSMRMNGTTGYHYDVALGKYASFRNYVITSWTEL